MRTGQTTSADRAWLHAHSRRNGDADVSFVPSHKRRRNQCHQATTAASATRVAVCRCFAVEILRRRPWKSVLQVNRELEFHKSAAKVLCVKVGARVRCTKNISRDGNLVTANNQVGTVVAIDPLEKTVSVRWDRVGCIDECVTEVRQTWWIKRQSFRVSGRVVHSIAKQLPLSLAWAVTLHSAQGPVFDRPVNIDHTKRDLR